MKLRAERFGKFGRTYTIDVVVTTHHQALVESAPRRSCLPNLVGIFGADGRY